MEAGVLRSTRRRLSVSVNFCLSQPSATLESRHRGQPTVAPLFSTVCTPAPGGARQGPSWEGRDGWRGVIGLCWIRGQGVYISYSACHVGNAAMKWSRSKCWQNTDEAIAGFGWQCGGLPFSRSKSIFVRLVCALSVQVSRDTLCLYLCLSVNMRMSIYVSQMKKRICTKNWDGIKLNL